MTDIIQTFEQCPARYLPEAYVDYDTQCGKRAGHVAEHATKFKIPMVLEDNVVRKALWSDVISVHADPDDNGVIVRCTCEWEFGPTTLLLDAQTEAFKHAEEMEHLLRRHGG